MRRFVPVNCFQVSNCSPVFFIVNFALLIVIVEVVYVLLLSKVSLNIRKACTTNYTLLGMVFSDNSSLG